MPKLLILCYLILFGSLCFSQNNRIILQSKNDTNRVNKLIEISNNFGWNSPDSQIFYANIALENSTKLNYQKGIFLSNQAIANACYVNGNYSLGLQSAKIALKIAQNLNNKIWLMQINNSIGLLYQQIQKFDESVYFFKNALQFCDSVNNIDRYAAICNNLANSFLRLNNSNQAHFFRSIALKLRLQNNDFSSLADTYNDIGEGFMLQNQNDSAIKYYLLCYAIKDSIGDIEMKALSANNLAQVYSQIHNFKLAKYYSLIALNLADSLNAPYYKLQALTKLEQIAEFDNDINNQIIYLKLIIKTKDTLYNIENQKQTNRLYFEFETEKKELEIKNLTIKQESSKKQRTVILLSSSLILSFLIIFLLILTNRYKIIRSQKHEIEKQHFILQLKNKEILDSINYAYFIQKSLISSEQKVNDLIISKLHFTDFFIFFKPRDIVSGDFYWIEQTNNGIYFAICDSTGHGVPGAFMSVLNINLLYDAINIREIKYPNEILTYVRQLLIKNLSYFSEQKDGMDACLLYFQTDNPKNILYSAAYNPPIIIRDTEIIELKYDKKPVGKSEHNDNFSLFNFDLQNEDTIFCFSDGFADQFSSKTGKRLKRKGFYSLLTNIAQLPSKTQKNNLQNFLDDYKGSEIQVDDILIIGIKV